MRVTEWVDGNGGLLGAIISVVGAIFFLRRKFYTDNNEIAKSQVETNLVQTLIKQAEVYKEDARRAWGQRTRDAEMIARQAVQIENLTKTIGVMKEILREVAPGKAAMFDSIQSTPSHDIWTPSEFSDDKGDKHA